MNSIYEQFNQYFTPPPQKKKKLDQNFKFTSFKKNR